MAGNRQPRKEYDNTNRGALWKNDKKRGEKDPDYTGTVDVNGVEHFINAFIVPKEKRNAGSPLMRLSIKEKTAHEEPAKGPAKSAPAAKPAQDFDDEIPF